MHVYLLRSKGVPNDLYQKVLGLLSGIEGPLTFRTTDMPIDFRDEVLSWDLVFSACSNFRQQNDLPGSDFVILLTEKPNSENWFSACDPQGSYSIFIHTDDWDYYVPCESEFPIAYEVVENVLERLMFADSEALIAHAHDTPRGCISDMCNWKQEISLKLRTADICPECLEILNQQGVELQLIQQSLQLMERIRERVLFSNQYRRANNDDQVLPFPVAITRRKLKNTLEPLKKFLLLLDHFDSLIRTSVLFVGPVMMGERFAEFRQQNELHRRPALGHWVSALRALSKSPRDKGIDLPDEILGRITDVANFSEREHIVQLRNDRRGHGYINPNNQSYAQEFENYRPIIQEIEKRLIPLYTKYKLCYVLSSDKIDRMSFRVTAISLMGSHPDFSQIDYLIKTDRLEDIPVIDQVFVHDPVEKRWFQVSPHIHYGDCPECHHTRVLLADGELYIDPYIGHRIRLVIR